MNNNDIIEVKHIYIIPIINDEYIKGLGNDKYYYFQVQNENHDIIDEYDVINIRGDIRQDIENGLFRYFPKIGNDSLYYDLRYHYVLDKYLDIVEEEIDKFAKYNKSSL